jgi:hypothetical protein
MRAAIVIGVETADVIALSLTELYSIHRRFCSNRTPPIKRPEVFIMIPVKHVTVAAAIVATVLSADVLAQGKSKDRGHNGDGSHSSVSVAVVFRDSDRVTFRDYFTTHRITPQPLPPGIAKKVGRGKPLPPGIAKRAVPPALLAVGPKVDRDVTFAIVGDVVVATRGAVVIDVLAGVFK